LTDVGSIVSRLAEVQTVLWALLMVVKPLPLPSAQKGMAGLFKGWNPPLITSAESQFEGFLHLYSTINPNRKTIRYYSFSFRFCSISDSRYYYADGERLPARIKMMSNTVSILHALPENNVVLLRFLCKNG